MHAISLARSTRRLLLVLLALAVAFLATSAAAPRAAQAAVYQSPVTAADIGWVYVADVGANLCTRSMPPQCRTGAWSWNQSAYRWDRTWIATDTQVYAYPYAAGFHWIWTNRSGWIAIETSKLTKVAPSSHCLGLQCQLRA